MLLSAVDRLSADAPTGLSSFKSVPAGILPISLSEPSRMTLNILSHMLLVGSPDHSSANSVRQLEVYARRHDSQHVLLYMIYNIVIISFLFDTNHNALHSKWQFIPTER